MRITEIKSRDDLEKLTIAQDDDCDYEESGYIVVADDRKAAICHYGHCSCYGTWTSLTGGDYGNSGNGVIQWDWTGTKKQLLKMAKNGLDPHNPIGNRKADPKDYDYDHLMNVYQQVIKWFAEQNTR